MPLDPFSINMPGPQVRELSRGPVFRWKLTCLLGFIEPLAMPVLPHLLQALGQGTKSFFIDSMFFVRSCYIPFHFKVKV